MKNREPVDLMPIAFAIIMSTLAIVIGLLVIFQK